ncbi:hypothetical protein D3C71_1263880 [compost metagenome]
MAVHAGADFSKEIEVLGRARNQLLAGLRNGQASVPRFKFGQLGDVGVDQFAQPPHEAGALLGGRVGPFGKSLGGGGHGGVDLCLAARGDLVDGCTRGGVIGDEAVGAIDLFAVDPMLDAHVRLLVLVVVHGVVGRRHF